MNVWYLFCSTRKVHLLTVHWIDVLRCLNMALLIHFLEVARNQGNMWQGGDKWFCLRRKKQ